MDGVSEADNNGFIRRIFLDLGVLTSHDDRVDVHDFLNANDAEIEPTIAVPTGLAAALQAGGSLPVGTAQYYKVTAVDPVGETVGSTQATATPTTGNQKVLLTWNAVTNATVYKVYRSTTTGVPGTQQLLAYSTTNSYVDDGTLSLRPGAVPTSAAIKVRPENPADFENSWLFDYENARAYAFWLVERVRRTYHV